MSSSMWLLLNIGLAAIFMAVWVGVPLWLVFKHPDTAPDASPVPRTRLASTRPVPAREAALAAVAAESPRRSVRTAVAAQALARPGQYGQRVGRPGPARA